MRTPAETPLLCTAPKLRGVLDEPAEFIALLRLIERCQMDGRLGVATDSWSGDVFFDHGRILAATRVPDCGLSALQAMVEDSPPKRIELYPWALLDGVAATVTDHALQRLGEMDALRADGPLSPSHRKQASQAGPAEHGDLIASLVTEVIGRDQWPVDALEVTAVLESLGITDEVAVQRYNTTDVFALGEEVYTRLEPVPSPA